MKRLILFLTIAFSLPSYANTEFVKKIQWQDGPEAREHTKMWVGKSKLYIQGGYVFTPLQGAIGNDLWEYDIESSQWTQLTIKGNAPDADGRGVYVDEDSSYYFLASKGVLFNQLNMTFFYKLTIKNGVGTYKILPYSPETDQNTLFRNSKLSSLVYNKIKKEFYSICNSADCDIYKFRINNEIVSVDSVKADGEIPGGRVGFSYGFDIESQTYIMASGQKTDTNSGTPTFSNSIWTLDFNSSPFRWVKSSNTITGRRNPCFAYNQKSKKLIIWGGTDDGQTSVPNLASISIQGNVENFAIEQKPRSSCSGAYDYRTESVILGFGNSESDQFRDLYFFK